MFAARGYHGTAVPEVAEAAGVGTGTLYHYFEHKQQLVNEMYRDAKLRLRGALLDQLAEPALDEPGAAKAWFLEVWRRLAAFAGWRARGSRRPMRSRGVAPAGGVRRERAGRVPVPRDAGSRRVPGRGEPADRAVRGGAAVRGGQAPARSGGRRAGRRRADRRRDRSDVGRSWGS